MLTVRLELANEETRAFRYELRTFLDVIVPKLTGERPDRKDTATVSYVIVRRLLAQLEEHLAKLERVDKEGKTKREGLRTARLVR